MSALRLASVTLQPLVVRVRRHARAAVHGVRDGLEHILDARTMSGLQPPVAMDVMPELW